MLSCSVLEAYREDAAEKYDVEDHRRRIHAPGYGTNCLMVPVDQRAGKKVCPLIHEVLPEAGLRPKTSGVSSVMVLVAELPTRLLREKFLRKEALSIELNQLFLRALDPGGTVADAIAIAIALIVDAPHTGLLLQGVRPM